MRPLPFIEVHETAALDASPLHVCAGFGFKLLDDVWVITRLVAPFLLQSIGFIAVHGCRPRQDPVPPQGYQLPALFNKYLGFRE
jgi:hypothetical protein